MGLQAVEARRDQRVERLRDVERGEVAGDLVAVLAGRKQAAVEQHAHRLDRVERDAVRALSDAADRVLGQARHEATEHVVDRLLGQRVERERGEVAQVRAPARVALRDVRPREGDDVDRMAPRPVEQVLDELDQRRVGPVDVLEDHDHRELVGHPLDEQAPRREEILTVRRHAVGQAEQVLQPWLDELALVRVGDDLGQHRRQLRRRLVGGLVLGDPGAHPHHLRETPSTRRRRRRRGSGRDATTPRSSSPSMYFSNSQASLDLPMPGAATIDSRCARRSSATVWNSSLTMRSSRSRPTNGDSTPYRPALATPCRHHAEGAIERHRLGLALELVHAGVRIDDRRLARAARRLADEHGSRLGDALDPRGGVDEVACHHPLTGRRRASRPPRP